MEASARRASFDVNGHQFEAILDVGGQWDGMAHVVDLEKRYTKPDPDGVCRHEIVITGAQWDGRALTVKASDVFRDDWMLVFEPAVAALRRLTQS